MFIRKGQVGLKLWIPKPCSKLLRQIRWVKLEYQASLGSHSPVWFVTLMTLAKASIAAELCLLTYYQYLLFIFVIYVHAYFSLFSPAGYRHIKLLSNTGEPLENSTLFVHIAITNRRGGGVSYHFYLIIGLILIFFSVRMYFNIASLFNFLMKHCELLLILTCIFLSLKWKNFSYFFTKTDSRGCFIVAIYSASKK